MANISALTSTANPSLAIGPNGATNPTLSTDSSVGSAATGIKAIGRAAASGASIIVTSSGTDEKLTVDAKGAGKVEIAGVSTGDVDVKRNANVTGKVTGASADAKALAIGPNGATNPCLQVDGSVSSAATGVKVTGRAEGAGADLTVVSSGTNEALAIDAKGSGAITLNGTATGEVTTPRALKSTGTGGVGYGTGAGGTVTQATSRTTGVTLNKTVGAITLVSAAGSATPFSFTVTNSTVAATDVIVLNQKSGTDKYNLEITAVADGSFQITANTTGGTTTEQPVINFAVIKGVAA